MNIVRGRRNIAMPHKRLDRTQVGIGLKKMGSEAVSKRMNSGRFRNTGPELGNSKDTLNVRGGNRFNGDLIRNLVKIIQYKTKAT
ncbi:hypothetical protein JCM15765_18230 [Paradesulfitobacterium aromaticivorans]